MQYYMLLGQDDREMVSNLTERLVRSIRVEQSVVRKGWGLDILVMILIMTIIMIINHDCHTATQLIDT